VEPFDSLAMRAGALSSVVVALPLDLTLA